MPETLSLVIPCRDVTVEIPHPPGLDEVILQGGGPAGLNRNLGAKRARGSILVFADDDLVLQGDLDWLRHRPAREVWWPPAAYVDRTGDPFSAKMAGWMNFWIGMKVAVGIGPVVAVRKRAWAAVGGYNLEDVHDDTTFARKLYEAFGTFGESMPVRVDVLRPFTPWKGVAEKRGAWRGRPLPTDGPFRRLVPAGSPAADRTVRGLDAHA